MASDWFYAPLPLASPEVELTGSEAHHIARVLRLGPGERVVLFDGRGTIAEAEITSVGKQTVELRIPQSRIEPEPAPAVILATAVPKGDRFRWLVEKATELGVSRLIPIETSRSVVEPGAGKLEKMRQTVIAACKQSHRSRLMEVDPVTNWGDLIGCELSGKTALVAHPAGSPLGESRELISGRPILLIVGPEGGLTETEVAEAAAGGARPVSLGLRILRIETAAIALSGYISLSSQTA